MRHTIRLSLCAMLSAICCISLRGDGGVDQASQPPAVAPQRQAHAHNDYLHERPLHDALEQGFCSVEADIFLTAQGLLIGHELKDLQPQRTLESLYLDPLRERIRARNGWVHAPDVPFYLLIDVKTEAKETYLALDRVLAQYADILAVTREGRFERKAVTVVLSGNRAQDAIKQQTVRYVGIDGRPEDLESTLPADLMPWISARWGSLFQWQGAGPFPPEERKKLRDYVRKAHQQGRQVRFWATLDKEFVWRELAAAEVDFINTDDLAGLRKFLMTQP
jgi:glycerophosphoryl diester phosphodiesterase